MPALGAAKTPLEAPVSGMVIGLTNLPLVYAGDATVHSAGYDRQVKIAERQVE